MTEHQLRQRAGGAGGHKRAHAARDKHQRKGAAHDSIALGALVEAVVKTQKRLDDAEADNDAERDHGREQDLGGAVVSAREMTGVKR